MNEQAWHDLLPFYVAGTLTPQEQAAVEAYLDRNPAARREVEAWGIIAGAVQAEAAARSDSLPPLNSHRLAQLTPPAARNGSPDITRLASPAPAPDSQAEIRTQVRQLPRQVHLERQIGTTTPHARRLNLPMTAAAAIVMLICFVGVLLAVLLQGGNAPSAAPSDPDKSPAVSPTPTSRATLTTVPNINDCYLSPAGDTAILLYHQPDLSSPTSGTISAGMQIRAIGKIETGWYQVVMGQEMGWVQMPDVIESVGCARLELMPLPDPATPTPLSPSPTRRPVSLPPVTLAPTLTPAICMAIAPETGSVHVYAEPHRAAALVNAMTGAYAVQMQTGAGWYFIEIGLHGGWIAGEDVSIQGDCTLIPPVTPPPTSTAFECYLSPVGSHAVAIHAAPDWDSPTIGLLQPDQIPAVTGRTSDGWHEIALTDQAEWVHSNQVRMYNRCDLLPIITPAPPPSDDGLASPTPSPAVDTVTPAPPPTNDSLASPTPSPAPAASSTAVE